MLAPIRQTMLAEIDELRSVWLSGSRTDPKLFLKDTSTFCTKLEKYLAIKQREQSSELDEQMRQDRLRFINQAFDHVTNIHEAEERKKSKFVQTISLFMQMLANFYHQAYEQFQDSHHQRNLINQATQRSAENFAQISLETKELKEKLLKTPWEQIQTVDSTSFREGYLFVLSKKAMSTIWVKHFCTYKRDVKQLDMIPYVQGRSSDLATEQYSVKSCVRRSSDSIDRRFCFDVEVENRSTPLTLQAQSQDDLVQWLRVMDGQEPQYADRLVSVVDADRTSLTPQSIQFFCRLLEVIEKQGLYTSGIYRISGVKSKICSLIRQALSPTGVSLQYLSECDVHLLTGTVKYFVRHLEEPLMTFRLYDDVVAAVKRSPEERLELLRHLLDLLPSRNREVLSILMNHLAKVASYSTRNNMTSSNLAIVFAPSLMRSQEESVAAIMNTKFSSTAVELMIDNCITLFGSHSPSSNSVARPVPPYIEPVYSTPVVNNPIDLFLFLKRLVLLVIPLIKPIQLIPRANLFLPSGNMLVDRSLRLNRDVIRRKPTAPPAPNCLPRPSPLVPTLLPASAESSSTQPNAVFDSTQSTESHQRNQQVSPKTTLSKPTLETHQDNVLSRTAAVITPRIANEQVLTLSDALPKMNFIRGDTCTRSPERPLYLYSDKLEAIQKPIRVLRMASLPAPRPQTKRLGYR
ncbi:Rho GTPase-activating protein 26 [Fasciola hepatica]|uniref:Rho GTPase-activating protein 26 n=1 Tax=Fasciola hepatica TaxID=6192 RepID=A0A4E0RXA8_FASHE|nr:Rho GTPase-activating protein 26 [Fasciola hepatica]